MKARLDNRSVAGTINAIMVHRKRGDACASNGSKSRTSRKGIGSRHTVNKGNHERVHRCRRRTLLAGASAVAAIGVPRALTAQADVIRIGHLTPRTGFLGPLGEFAVQAADMAVAEINAAGGVNGRKIELLKEDSVNPQTASTKAERMIERDKVACIIGEISSASA